MSSNEHYPDLISLIMNIAQHIDEYDDTIEIASFEKEMIYGWKCTKTGKIWTIELSKVRKLGLWQDNPIVPIVKEMIGQHQAERNEEHWQLRIIHNEQIRRLCRMMAFW